jgi:7-carboxy-7-deazaguanine synthase
VLRVNEIYTSLQGEGPFVGLPTQFVRFAGCNMRCPGWPCDTPHAIYPDLIRNDSYKGEARDILKDVADWPRHLCLTGGEPFVQRSVHLKEFVELAWEQGYSIEAFTNGSFQYPEWVKRFGVRLMMDWKLEGSGEAATARENRIWNYNNRLDHRDGVKFVVVDEADLQEALEVWRGLTLGRAHNPQFWIGAAWDRIDNKRIVEFVLEHELPWRLNIQVHKVIWEPNERKV